MRFPSEVAVAVRAVWPPDKVCSSRTTPRYSRTSWKTIGIDCVCISLGEISPQARVAVAKRAERLVVQSVGMIADPRPAEAIVAEGHADRVEPARGFLHDPRWVWHAADALGAEITCPPQYQRARTKLWPGVALAHPQPGT